MPSNLVAHDRVQRRRSQRLAGAQAETGVVPRTADGVIDDESVGERATVMAARGADRIYVVAAAHNDDRRAVDVTA